MSEFALQLHMSAFALQLHMSAFALPWLPRATAHAQDPRSGVTYVVQHVNRHTGRGREPRLIIVCFTGHVRDAEQHLHPQPLRICA
jgi:hypothetical protein